VVVCAGHQQQGVCASDQRQVFGLGQRVIDRGDAHLRGPAAAGACQGQGGGLRRETQTEARVSRLAAWSGHDHTRNAARTIGAARRSQLYDLREHEVASLHTLAREFPANV
jgi:hypothetical protein